MLKPSSLSSIGVQSYNESPRLATDPQGNLWAAFLSCLPHWEGPRGPASLRAFLFVRNQKGWPAPVALSGHPAVPQALDLETDPSGEIWAVWTEKEGRNWRLCASRPLDPEVMEWAKPLVVAEGRAELDPSLAPHPEGGVAVCWCSFDPEARRFRIRFARLGKDGLPSPPVWLSPPQTHAFRPAVAATKDGFVVAYEIFRPPASYVLVASPLCFDGTAGEPFVIADDADFNGFAVAAPSSKGAFIAWSSRWGTKGARALTRCALVTFDGKLRFPPPVRSDMPEGSAGVGFFRPAIALDERGRLWVAGCEHEGVRRAPLWLRALTKEGWSQPIRVGPDEEGFHRYYKERKRPFQTSLDLHAHKRQLFLAFTHWVPNHGPKLLYLAEFDTSPLPEGPVPMGEERKAKALEVKPLPPTPWGGGVAFAELHGHSMLSYDAYGAPDEWFLRARYEKGLQVAALTDHDKTAIDHALCDALCRCLTEEGEFVALNGYEDCFAPPSVGDKVVLCFDDAPVYWSLLQLGHPWPPRERYIELLRSCPKCLLISHDGWMFNADPRGGICDRDWWDGELSPVVQVTSAHALPEDFERFVPELKKRPKEFFRFLDALKRGFRYGAVGGSDSHWPDPQVRTGLWLEELTVEGVFRALKLRRCFATTGVRVALELFADGKPMGSEISVAPRKSVRLEGRAKSLEQTPLASLELVRNGEVVASASGPAPELEIEFADSSAEPAFFYLRARLADGNMAFSSPIWLDRPRQSRVPNPQSPSPD